MRRAEQEITNHREIDALLREGSLCHLGLMDEGIPYVVPVTYGYDGESLYIHSAMEGRKMDLLRTNPMVCFEITPQWSLVPGKRGCDWTASYESVIGWGRAWFVDNHESKLAAFEIILQQVNPGQPHTFSPDIVSKTAVIRIDIANVTGKRSQVELL